VGTLKLHSNGPLYSSTVIDTLSVDGWAVTFGTVRWGHGGLWSRLVGQSPPHCTISGQFTNFILLDVAL